MNRTLVIAISILLAFCAGIYFWTEWQKKEFDASLPKPPAVEEQQVADDTAGGHWHGDEWHAEPHTAHAAEDETTAQQAKPNKNLSSAKELKNPTPEQIAAMDQSFYGSLGLEVPPPGYHYIWEGDTDDWVVSRDENGNPIMMRKDEPYVEISTTIGFAPTREQWDRYQQLLRARDLAFINDDDAEYQQLTYEMEQLEAEAQGELPSFASTWIIDAPEGVDIEDREEEMHRKVDEIVRQTYRDWGLEYLLP